MLSNNSTVVNTVIEHKGTLLYNNKPSPKVLLPPSACQPTKTNTQTDNDAKEAKANEEDLQKYILHFFDGHLTAAKGTVASTVLDKIKPATQ